MATLKTLSKIKELPLRTCWQNEATDFTPWLAKEENLSQLAAALGIGPFEDVEQEVAVGTFSADICCVDRSSGSDKVVLIENQLEETNHSHLGQILTYAAGKEASIIIWIAKQIRERHRAAIDWLNRHTDESTRFFAVEIHLVQIDNGNPAPLFKVVAMPDKWKQDVDNTERAMKELTPERQGFYKFWAAFIEYMKAFPSAPFRTQGAAGKREMNIHMGTTIAKINLKILSPKNNVGVELYINEDKAIFDSLSQEKATIEQALGALQWDRKENNKKATITLINPSLNYSNDERQWEDIFAWYREQTEKFINCFQKRVKEYKS